MDTKVTLRAQNEQKVVHINDGSKPLIKDAIRDRWQSLINIVANIMNVPAGLIMTITEEHMEVFLRSENEDNPYPEDGKDTLGHGLYCETVIGTDKELHVDNSLFYDAWKDNPDVALNMISYYGLPLKWPDGVVFGTICALDNKTNQFAPEYRQLMNQFKNMIEMDLRVLQELQQLEYESGIDALTNIANRRQLDRSLAIWMEDFIRYNTLFTLVMIDIDRMKEINDTYGHVIGDHILQKVSYILQQRTRKGDLVSRYGGDEFVLLMKHLEDASVETVMTDIQSEIAQDSMLKTYTITISYGSAAMNETISKKEELLIIADKRMYDMKQQ